MKKVCLVCPAAIVLLSAAFVATGFQAQTDIFLTDFSVSDDNSELTFSVVSASSAGHTRGFADKGGGYELVLEKDETTGKWQRATQ